MSSFECMSLFFHYLFYFLSYTISLSFLKCLLSLPFFFPILCFLSFFSLSLSSLILFFSHLVLYLVSHPYFSFCSLLISFPSIIYLSCYPPTFVSFHFFSYLPSKVLLLVCLVSSFYLSFLLSCILFSFPLSHSFYFFRSCFRHPYIFLVLLFFFFLTSCHSVQQFYHCLLCCFLFLSHLLFFHTSCLLLFTSFHLYHYPFFICSFASFFAAVIHLSLSLFSFLLS